MSSKTDGADAAAEAEDIDIVFVEEREQVLGQEGNAQRGCDAQKEGSTERSRDTRLSGGTDTDREGDARN